MSPWPSGFCKLSTGSITSVSSELCFGCPYTSLRWLKPQHISNPRTFVFSRFKERVRSVQFAEASCVPPRKGTAHTHLREDGISGSARPCSTLLFLASHAGAVGGKTNPCAEGQEITGLCCRAGRLRDSSHSRDMKPRQCTAVTSIPATWPKDQEHLATTRGNCGAGISTCLFPFL